MAHTAIGQIGPNDAYELGTYRFTVAYAYDQSLNATTLQALCGREGHELKAATKRVANQAEIVSWSIEANDTTVDVYAIVNSTLARKKTSSFFPSGIEYGDTPIKAYKTYYYEEADIGAAWKAFNTPIYTDFVGAADHGGAWKSYELDAAGHKINITTVFTQEYTYQGKTAYYAKASFAGSVSVPTNIISYTSSANGKIAWTLVYGEETGGGSETKEVLIGRFAIDPHEAGATGPDSFWIDPLDWNSDPTKVLNLTVNGALSGRHNDPLNQNADYSYIPTDQAKATGYGCGGHGGHGGGGGGGASTIVINRFATDRANSKNIVTKPKRHGYGSGGGKGGEGGDGCILIYY